MAPHPRVAAHAAAFLAALQLAALLALPLAAAAAAGGTGTATATGAAAAGATLTVGAPGDLVLTLLSDTLPAAKGGRCMDGSMTGYYYRKGVADTYVVFMHGGGGCSTEATCKRWAAEKGSSKDWQRTALGTSYGVTVSNCTSNPYFCNATARL